MSGRQRSGFGIVRRHLILNEDARMKEQTFEDYRRRMLAVLVHLQLTQSKEEQNRCKTTPDSGAHF
jgi:hypothetical protein